MSRISDALQRADAKRRGNASNTRPIAGTEAHGNGNGTAQEANDSHGEQRTISWELAIARITTQLEELSARLAQGGETRARVEAQLKAKEALAASLHEEQLALKQQLTSVDQVLRGAEEEREVCARQLESLRQCQQLSEAVRAAEGELEANQSAIRELQLNMTQRQQHERDVRERITQLRFKLGQVLAFTGTTDASASEEDRAS